MMLEIYTLMWMIVQVGDPSMHRTLPTEGVWSSDRDEIVEIARGLQHLKIPGTDLQFAVAVYAGDRVIFPEEIQSDYCTRCRTENPITDFCLKASDDSGHPEDSGKDRKNESVERYGFLDRPVPSVGQYVVVLGFIFGVFSASLIFWRMGVF